MSLQQFVELRFCLCQIESVHGLGETQVGVDAGYHNAGFNCQDLDADQGHPNVDVDY
jgi:hypothetical protein